MTELVQASFPLSNHLAMVADPVRMQACFAALDQVLRPGLLFCEVGCGTGVFSLHAAKAGCRVIAIERDAQALKVACEAVSLAGLSERVTFIQSDFEILSELPEGVRADVIFCEMLSPWLAREGQVAAAAHAKTHFLAEGGVLIPESVVNRVELGWTRYEVGGVQVPAPSYQHDRTDVATIMTEARILNRVELGEPATEVDQTVELEALASGQINCARLSSVVQLGTNVPFFTSLSMMPIATVPLLVPLEVLAGQRLLFRARYHYRQSLANASLEAELVIV